MCAQLLSHGRHHRVIIHCCNRGLRLPLTTALAHPTLLYHSRHDRSREGRELKEVRLGRCGAYDAYGGDKEWRTCKDVLETADCAHALTMLSRRSTVCACDLRLTSLSRSQGLSLSCAAFTLLVDRLFSLWRLGLAMTDACD